MSAIYTTLGIIGIVGFLVYLAGGLMARYAQQADRARNEDEEPTLFV